MTTNTGTGGDAGNDSRVEAALDVRWPNKEWRNFLPQDNARERREMVAILSAADAARPVVCGSDVLLGVMFIGNDGKSYRFNGREWEKHNGDFWCSAAAPKVVREKAARPVVSDEDVIKAMMGNADERVAKVMLVNLRAAGFDVVRR